MSDQDLPADDLLTWLEDPGEVAALLVVLLHPGTDSWTGQPAELTREIACKVGFLSALVEDELVRALFEAWSERLIASGSLTLPPPPWAREQTDALLRGLGIPWPWLSKALVRFYFALLAKMVGLPVPGQKLSDMIGDPVLAPPGTKRRRFPKGDGEHLQDWATWFYRVRVRRESVRSLAMERHAEKKHRRQFEDCDCRRTVRLGLKEAERLLDTPE